ncbi:unnamed protein product [Nesidiocoris tenuis]|uniref:Uncharacterized protein n=1 Tax=Nesidiocoris tenuis TaxID=355587 RepID=A0A6H5GNT5_9HEMI|nr:unnamed protein product [Nesidiocoris tenuis]
MNLHAKITKESVCPDGLRDREEIGLTCDTGFSPRKESRRTYHHSCVDPIIDPPSTFHGVNLGRSAAKLTTSSNRRHGLIPEVTKWRFTLSIERCYFNPKRIDSIGAWKGMEKKHPRVHDHLRSAGGAMRGVSAVQLIISGIETRCKFVELWRRVKFENFILSSEHQLDSNSCPGKFEIPRLSTHKQYLHILIVSYYQNRRIGGVHHTYLHLPLLSRVPKHLISVLGRNQARMTISIFRPYQNSHQVKRCQVHDCRKLIDNRAPPRPIRPAPSLLRPIAKHKLPALPTPSAGY